MQLNNDNKLKVGAVSFFNARALIYKLNDNPDIELTTLPPAQLAGQLDSGGVDVALVPSIDYQRSNNRWLILPCAAIGSYGRVLTVQVFSHVPPQKITRLLCDCDSHTSVCLAKIIWHLRYNTNLQTHSLDSHGSIHEIYHKLLPKNLKDTSNINNTGVLLIGDKVLTELNKWEYHIDLGLAWTELTELPFVYAFWASRTDNIVDIPDADRTQNMAATYQDGYKSVTNIRPEASITDIVTAVNATNADKNTEYRMRVSILGDILRKTSLNGQKNIDGIVKNYAAQHGFNAKLAHNYLTDNIRFEFSAREICGLTKFYELSYKFDLIKRLRPIIYASGIVKNV